MRVWAVTQGLGVAGFGLNCVSVHDGVGARFSKYRVLQTALAASTVAIHVKAYTPEVRNTKSTPLNGP